MINNNFKSAAEPRYEAPVVAVLEIENEGAVCAASAQEFGDETDASDLLDW